MTTRLCGAERRSGGHCQKPAGWGTKHNGYGNCKLHGGATPSGIKHAADLRKPDVARRVSLEFGLPWTPLPEPEKKAMEGVILGRRHDSRPPGAPRVVMGRVLFFGG